MEELNEGVAPSFLMDEGERAGGGGWRKEGRGLKAREEEKQAVTGMQTP